MPVSTRWRRQSPIPDAGRRSTCTSRSTPACTASAARPTTRSRSHARSRRATSSCSPACAPTSQSPTNRTTPTPVSSWRASTPCSTRSTPKDSGPPLAHAANSAGLLVTGARYDLARVGIACYGLPPAPAVADGEVVLRPALSLRARVTFVKTLPVGARVSYGLRSEVRHVGSGRHRARRVCRRCAAQPRDGRW